MAFLCPLSRLWAEEERSAQNLKSSKSRLFQCFVEIVGVKREGEGRGDGGEKRRCLGRTFVFREV